jgi:hypothetical protein
VRVCSQLNTRRILTENTPPVVERTKLVPLKAVTTSNLTCLNVGVYDEDPDDVTFTFNNSWLVNGAEVANVTEDVLLSEYFIKGPPRDTASFVASVFFVLHCALRSIVWLQ